ncbi:MAG: DUF2894 domain-containing protein [Pseudoxanthomonas sp.]|nr:DUF2894 domain-containing protein [Pseudoxanthomonas sp.]
MAADAVHAQLQAWRAAGADRFDPLRFGFLEALATRVPRHAGQARELLEQRLAVLLQAYAKDLVRTPAREPMVRAAVAAGPLGELLAGMGRPLTGTSSVAAVAAGNDADGTGVDVAAGAQAVPAPAFAPLPVLDELRTVWSRMRNDRQLRESLDQVPADAGPLNSDMLVHRALQLMQATAPGYLQHFIAYADALSSLQQLREGGAGEAAAAPAGRKPARTRTRKRAG